ncbi:cytochrome c oxidase cbb3-type subunit 4 [Idiomarina fontislapidosi]|uniref:CcoQ/FixQ family Cbb3-type cytochrome c oxidase assembly chaperone n=1 Tax=Idiomarina fontislapidosi TaxID=263723 RepID=A0A432Y9M1_9GAMM|nr:CcoQ/FixQ family Cbb3-type cytochrome c oxidase assembly chaperone [Idiomarina fontislapidosi]PYE34354.1 cytochrome c oxidase cbb3-type subunit 4 [Idiomarina fontislapidosi]RUO57685.1 CcoQ/FixQ family Cbb3-type cytochrome c oxidase assembly chaperone [Idiomarina fontislapidosi]|tara:strand:- start:495 stop:701 length:207 start_codon:yes stop_codon:yes gene_type:complete
MSYGDYGTWRGLFSIVILVIFIAIVLWVYLSRRANKQFDEAANSIFDEGELDNSSNEKSEKPESKKDE